MVNCIEKMPFASYSNYLLNKVQILFFFLIHTRVLGAYLKKLAIKSTFFFAFADLQSASKHIKIMRLSIQQKET